MGLIVAAEYTSRGVWIAFESLASESVDLFSVGGFGVGGVMYWVMKSSIDSALVRSTSGKPVRKLH